MHNFLNFALPNSCILCRAACGYAKAICSACEKELPYVQGACTRCGVFLQSVSGAEKEVCGDCLTRRLPFNNNFALFHYRSPIDRLIIDLKFKHKLLYAKLLGQLLAEKIYEYYQSRPKPQSIIPIPLHAKRLRERGFNQALEIAKPIAKRLKVFLDKQSCMRLKHTAAQSSLPFAERRKNVQKAFAVKKTLVQQHIIILDDVITSGSTVYEFSKILRRSGAVCIDVWSCARAYDRLP